MTVEGLKNVNKSYCGEARLKQILLIEDEESIAKPLAKLLGMRGYDTFLAKDGVEGLEILKQNPSMECILVDIMMPRMNGWEFRAKQLTQEPLKNIPVVFLSADNQSARDAQSRGESFIPKPIDLDHLFSAIQHAVPVSQPLESRPLKPSPWHDVKSSLTAAQLGLRLLHEQVREEEIPESEIDRLFGQIGERIDLSIKRLNSLQESFRKGE